jgi:DNA-binding NtrC family response regulator
MDNHSPAEPLTLATVLFVGLDAGTAQDLVQSLAEERYLVIAAASAAEAMNIVATRPVDVVLADQQLLGVAGGELFSGLRSWQPSIIRILMAGEGDVNAAMRAVNAGRAHHWLRKPCDPGQLALMLFNVLVQRSFLPPESEGVLPTPPPSSRPMASRSPAAG